MRTKSTGGWIPYMLGAAAGTFLLAFVPSNAWLNGAQTSGEMLSAITLKHLLTVLLLLIVPALWARLAHLTTAWVLIGLSALAFGCAVWLNGDPVSALYTAGFIVLPGAGLYGLQKRKLTNFRTVIYESFVILAALFVLVCLRDLIESGDAYRSFRGVIALYGQVVKETDFSGMSISGADLAGEMQATADAFRVSAETVCVPILLLPAMAAGLSGTLFSHLFNRKGGAALSPLPRFEAWRCERWYVILTIVFLFVTMTLGMFGVQTANALSGVADTLWRLPCMLAGLCALRRFGVVSGRKWPFRFAIVLLILLPPIMGMLLSIIGMLASLRKPKNVEEDGGRK